VNGAEGLAIVLASLDLAIAAAILVTEFYRPRGGSRFLFLVATLLAGSTLGAALIAIQEHGALRSRDRVINFADRGTAVSPPRTLPPAPC
jgi:hypothetical protein